MVAVAAQQRVGCDRCVSVMYDGPVGPHSKSCGCPCRPDGCKHAAAWEVQDRVAEAQRRLREKHGIIVVPRCRAHFRAIARWWELESERGYTGVVDDAGLNSSDRSRMYAANYRWLVELMDNGHRVTAYAHGVYVGDELASAYMARQRKAAAVPVAPRKRRGRR